MQRLNDDSIVSLFVHWRYVYLPATLRMQEKPLRDMTMTGKSAGVDSGVMY